MITMIEKNNFANFPTNSILCLTILVWFTVLCTKTRQHILFFEWFSRNNGVNLSISILIIWNMITMIEINNFANFPTISMLCLAILVWFTVLCIKTRQNIFFSEWFSRNNGINLSISILIIWNMIAKIEMSSFANFQTISIMLGHDSHFLVKNT